jgi:radical SAM superfamily enzyme
MAGLPGEGVEDFLASVAFVSALPVTGVKFHNTLVVAGAPLAALYEAGEYVPMAREDYITAVCDGLARLRPGIAVERLNADPAPGELVAPAWAADKQGLLRDIRAHLEAEAIFQGCRLGPDGLP